MVKSFLGKAVVFASSFFFSPLKSLVLFASVVLTDLFVV